MPGKSCPPVLTHERPFRHRYTLFGSGLSSGGQRAGFGALVHRRNVSSRRKADLRAALLHVRFAPMRACVAATFLFLPAGCQESQPRPAEAREIVGTYRGVGTTDIVPRPNQLRLSLKADGSFRGNVLGGPGSYPALSGRWRVGEVNALGSCRVVRFTFENADPHPYCFTRMPDGTLCLGWSTNAPITCELRTSNDR